MRRSALVALVLLASTGACTSLLGDFTLGSGPGATDAGPDSTMMEAGPSEGGEEGGSVTATAIGNASNVYLGGTATLDGTHSSLSDGSQPTWSWSILKAPSGSNIGTNSIQGGNLSTATFKPDVVGEYTVVLTVAGTEAAPVQATLIVYCGLPQVLYAAGVGGTQGPYLQYEVVGLDGGAARAITCPAAAPGDPLSGADLPPFGAFGGRAFDTWEAPPPDPAVDSGTGAGSHLAGFTIDYQSGMGYFSHLWGATSLTSCDAGVTDYRTANFGPGKPYGSEPSFRPDGQRFAVFDISWNILTFAWGSLTGSNNIAPYPITLPGAGVLDPTTSLGADGGALQSYFQVPPRIQWLPVASADGGPITSWQVAWAIPHPEPDGGLGWAIVAAPDQSNSQPQAYMQCGGVVPRQFAFLPDGSVIAAYRPTPNSAEDIVHLKPMGGSGGPCALITNYTSLSGGFTSIATDFALSPDNPPSMIAFLRLAPALGDSVTPWLQGGAQLPGGYLYTVPVAGGMLNKLTPDPALLGPRWIGGGTQVVFTRIDGVSDAGNLATSVVVVTPQGMELPPVARGDGVTTFVSTSGNAACGVSPGNAAGGAAGLIGLVGLAAFARRRRRTR
jgi:MYXO-CTERM domain-containing protein